MGWSNLSLLQQVLWVLAVLSTGFFLVSTLLSVVGVGDIDIDGGGDLPGADLGADSAPDVGADTHESAPSEVLEYLTVRNVLAFALGFSWTGLLFHAQFGALALLPALPVGGAFGFLNAWLTRSLRGLETSGNANLNEAIGQQARVSVQIDEHLGSAGKVVVRVRERELELLAQTEDAAPLRRGERVQVYAVENGVLWVSRHDKLGLESLSSTLV